MSYDCQMSFCIQESICELTSIRYSLKSLIPDDKTAKPRKICEF